MTPGRSLKRRAARASLPCARASAPGSARAPRASPRRHRPGKAMDGGLLTERSLEPVRVHVRDLGGIERSEAFLQLLWAGERLGDRHLLVEREADEERERMSRDQLVRFVARSEIEALRGCDRHATSLLLGQQPGGVGEVLEVGECLQVAVPAFVLPQELSDELAAPFELSHPRRVEQFREVDVELGQARSAGNVRAVVDLAEGGVALMEVEQAPQLAEGILVVVDPDVADGVPRLAVHGNDEDAGSLPTSPVTA